MNSPEIIQLIHFKVEHLEVHFPVVNTTEADKEPSLSIHYEVYDSGHDPGQFLLQLRLDGVGEVSGGNRKSPDFAIQVIGIFDVPRDADEEIRQTMVRMNGGMILYGMVRGHLAALSGLLTCGSIIIPTVHWKDVVLDVESRRHADGEKKKKKGKAASTKTTPAKRKTTRPRG